MTVPFGVSSIRFPQPLCLLFPTAKSFPFIFWPLKSLTVTCLFRNCCIIVGLVGL